MKRYISMLLVALLTLAILTSAASAASFSVPTCNKGDGAVLSGVVTKTTAIGSAATGSVSSITSGAKFILRVRKDTGYKASNTATVSSTSSFSMSSLKDGNGQWLLRKGYDYKLAYTHSTASGVDSGSCSGTWKP